MIETKRNSYSKTESVSTESERQSDRKDGQANSETVISYLIGFSRPVHRVSSGQHTERGEGEGN